MVYTLQKCYDLFREVYFEKGRVDYNFYQLIMYPDESGELFNYGQNKSIKTFKSYKGLYIFLQSVLLKDLEMEKLNRA